VRSTLVLVAAFALGCAPRIPSAAFDSGELPHDGSAHGDVLTSRDTGYERPDALAMPPADLTVVLPYLGPEVTTDLDVGAALDLDPEQEGPLVVVGLFAPEDLEVRPPRGSLALKGPVLAAQGPIGDQGILKALHQAT